MLITDKEVCELRPSAGKQGMFLNPDEIAQLTGKRRPKAQARALESMGIPCRIRPDGRPMVMRTHVEAIDAPSRHWLASGQHPAPELQP